MKCCSGCQEQKELTEFSPDARARDGRQSRCKKCKTADHRSYLERDGNRQAMNTKRRVSRRSDPRIEMLREAAKRARKRGTPFALTIADILVPQFCPVLGLPLIAGGSRNNAPSLDAIIPDRGYVLGNVQVISTLANRMKNNATPDQLVLFARWVLENFDGSARGLDPGQSTRTDQDQHAREAPDGSRTWSAGIVEDAGDGHSDPAAQVVARSDCH